jgi:AraC-like DNA-binding protein
MVTMINIGEFAEVVSLLDRAASPSVVDRALRHAGASRNVLTGQGDFVPYSLEAIIFEHVARALGDRHLGARLGQEFNYGCFGPYADYVLGGKDLATALYRGRRAFNLISTGAEVVGLVRDGHLLVGRRCGQNSMVGVQHLDEGTVHIILCVMRRFLGPEWRPAWVEITRRDPSLADYMEDLLGVPVHMGAEMPGVAVGFGDLVAPNPRPPAAGTAITFAELPRLMSAKPPRTAEDLVWQVLASQLGGDALSEDVVASRLAMGPRTLQRALQVEGTSFREVKARFVETRARALLLETDLEFEEIALSLGYKEPKSFRRAFKTWTGLTPTRYRDLMRSL